MDNVNAHYAKPALAIAIAALLFAGTFAALPLLSGKALAQGAISITTSSDIHANKFFGPAILEVRIQDPALAADNAQSIAVPVSLTAFGATGTVNVDETSTTSGTLLLYIHVSKTAVAAAPTTPANPLSTTFTNLVIGPGAAFPVLLSNINEGGSIQINYGGVTKTVTYDDTSASISLDRTVYGAAAKIYTQVNDQDFNLDPTESNTFSEAVAGTLVSGTDRGVAVILYTETGVNTAKFEGTLITNALPSGVETQGRSLTANDYKNITSGAAPAVTLGAGGVVGTSSASYNVQEVRGTIQPLGTLSYANDLPVVIKDADRNSDSRAQEAFTRDLHVTVDSTTSNYKLKEQALNSENIVPSYGNDVIQLTFKDPSSITQGVINARPGHEVTLNYDDANPNANTSSISFKLSQATPTLSADKSTVGTASVLTLTLKDANLNDDSGVVESYTIQYTSATTTHANGKITFGSTDVMSMEIQRNGSPLTIGATPFAVTFTETGADTGIFEGTVRMDTLASRAGITWSDGDTQKYEIKKLLDDTVNVKPTSSVTITVGIESPTLKLDKQTTGVPRDPAIDDPDDRSNLGDALARITLTDPASNTNTLSEESLLASNSSYTSATGLVWASGKFKITFTPASGATFGGQPLVNVVDSVKETGIDTGIFTGTFAIRATATDKPAWIGAKAVIEYAGVDGIFGNSDDPSKATVTFTARSATLQTDTVLVVTGGKVTVTVRDADSNRDSELAEQVKVQFEWDDSTAGSKTEFLTLDETGDDTGVFTATVNVGTDTIDSTTFKPKPDTDVTLTYFDLTPSMSATASAWLSVGNTNVQLEKTLNVGSNAGALSIGGATKIGPSTKLQVVVVDNDLNANPNSKDDTGSKITIVTDRGVSIEMSASESEANSGRFTGDLSLEPAADKNDISASGDGTDDVTISVLPGDVISVRYQDDKGANGQKTTVSKTVEVTSVDPEIKTDRTEYGPNDQITLTLADIDADKDPDSSDIKNVRVTSTTDAVGLTSVQLIETGASTGVFSGLVQLSSTFSTGSLQVSPGDTVQIKYTDDFPADYKTRLDNGGTLTKDFFATVKIGGASVTGGNQGSTTPTAPSLKDISGKPLTEVAAGSQVLLSTTIKNNEANARSFVAIIDVRDSTGQTISLQFQTGTLAGNEQKSIGASWTPSDAGSYKVSTFVLSGLGTAGMILSPKAEATVTVS